MDDAANLLTDFMIIMVFFPKQNDIDLCFN